MDNNEITLFKEASRVWGDEMQTMVLFEEIGELMQAVSKHKRNPRHPTHINLLQEIADVEIMLDQLKLRLDAVSMVAAIRKQKINRLEIRLNEFKASNHIEPEGKTDEQKVMDIEVNEPIVLSPKPDCKTHGCQNKKFCEMKICAAT